METTKLVKELQGMKESGYLSDPILRKAVRTLEQADERFDWVGVYLMKEGEDKLWLHNYVGEPTEHAMIDVGQGVCGTAVAEKKNQNVPDVSEVENYLACSPRVKSELVVLIRAGDEILGQIDIDSHQKAAFQEQDEQEVQAVADKLAEVLMADRH
ncbi:MAG TPA: GAF domain-containing protein [Longimicrobiales bacterium]|nr:GAF domain-containing protein [Longimicrobiales bacterium]